ncbi:MAG: VWA domain-containing protein [Deltaproteobacteria bacterium]|nr:VWA domain-containing protein [Deltaproteobacteria bacterium]
MRWAFFGAEAHRTDYTTQAAYFSLRTADSQAMIQQEHKGVLFVDNHRRLSAYLRVLWGRDFWLRPAAAERSEFKPYIEGFVLHLPDAVEDTGPLKGLESYRAIAAHMAAHVVYTPQPLSAQALNPAQMALIGLMEDARVEFCAMTDLPGLRHSWRTLLAAARPGAVEHPTIATLEQLALALLDDGHPTGDEQLDTLARTFHASVASRRLDPTLSWDLGMTLYHHLNTRKQLPSLRLLESLRIPYRDDNRHPWQTEVSDWERALEVVRGPRQVRRKVSLMEFINETDVETAGDDAQEVWVLDGVLYDDDGVTYNEKEGREPVSDPFHYPEWDYKVQLHRPDWTTVYERRSPKGDAAVIDEILHRHRPTTHRLRQIVERLRPQGVVRQRKLEDGDEIDLNAAVDALVNLRSGHSYDPRITMRYVIKRRDLAVVILLDLSESTNDPVRGAENTVLSLTREASALLAQAVQNIGDPFAIHGFCSDGRHDVKYYRLKDFDSHFEASVKSNLAGMTGGFSTRMGSALRHAGQHLLNQPQRRKLLLLVTDGAPADIDEREPAHLRHDAKKAVEELTTRGITPFCLTLDPRADPYAAHIFGPKGYTIVDRVERLPERLPMLFVKLTG